MGRNIPEDVWDRYLRYVKKHQCQRMEKTAIFDSHLYDLFETSRYISPLAVAPGYQGCGLGAAILQTYHRLVPATPSCLFTSTDQQVSARDKYGGDAR